MTDDELYSMLNEDQPLQIGTRVGFFGGKEDYDTGQDSGQFAGAEELKREGKPSYSYDPETGDEPKSNYVAVNPEWIKKGVLDYGDEIRVYNPNEPDRSAVFTVSDLGPAKWTGRGIDLPPHAANLLGVDTDEQVGIDFEDYFQRKAQGKHKTPTGEDIRNMIDQQPDDSMIAGNVTKASIQQAIDENKPTQNEDGSLSIGNGISYYPSGIVQIDAGDVMYQYFPGSDKPHIVNKAQSNDPDIILSREATKKGVLRSDYPAGQDGDKQFREAAKLALGAGAAEDIAEGIMSGKQPPDTKGLYRLGPQVRAILARHDYDYKNAALDWYGAQRFIASTNSPPLTRLRLSTQTAIHSLDVIDELAGEWKGGQFPALNRARLSAAMNGALGEKAASIARRLDGQIKDLTFELGNVYMGGNTPTDQSLKLAGSNLSADWDEQVLKDMTNLARRNLQIRQNSFSQVTPVSMKDEEVKEENWRKQNPTNSPQPQPVTTPKGTFKVGDPVKLHGKIVTITKINPDGTIEYK